MLLEKKIEKNEKRWLKLKELNRAFNNADIEAIVSEIEKEVDRHFAQTHKLTTVKKFYRNQIISKLSRLIIGI